MIVSGYHGTNVSLPNIGACNLAGVMAQPGRRRRDVGALVAALALAATVGSLLLAREPAATMRLSQATMRATTYNSTRRSEAERALGLNCSLEDDDERFTYDACEGFDRDSCAMYCTEDSWCSHFCGAECKKGVGALCALRVLSNLTHNCETNGLCDLPAHAKRTGSMAVRASAIVGPNETGLTLPASADGCDNHALCSECLYDDNCERLVLEGEVTSANMAMLLLSQFKETCSWYGCERR